MERSQSNDGELLDQQGQELLRHVLGSSWDPAYNQEAEFDVYSIHPALGQSSVFNLAIQLQVLSELWTNIMNFTFHGVPKYTYCIQWPKTTSGEPFFPSFQPSGITVSVSHLCWSGGEIHPIFCSGLICKIPRICHQLVLERNHPRVYKWSPLWLIHHRWVSPGVP